MLPLSHGFCGSALANRYHMGFVEARSPSRGANLRYGPEVLQDSPRSSSTPTLDPRDRLEPQPSCSTLLGR